jgi:predicted GIY-YIG superfamily endonuclease
MNKNSYWIYVIELNSGNKYVGQTNNLERRLLEHRQGRSPYTRKHKVKKLIYSEMCNSRSEAIVYWFSGKWNFHSIELVSSSLLFLIDCICI